MLWCIRQNGENEERENQHIGDNANDCSAEREESNVKLWREPYVSVEGRGEPIGKYQECKVMMLKWKSKYLTKKEIIAVRKPKRDDEMMLRMKYKPRGMKPMRNNFQVANILHWNFWNLQEKKSSKNQKCAQVTIKQTKSNKSRWRWGVKRLER